MDKMWPWLIDPYSIYVKPMDGKDPKNFSLMNTTHIDTRIHTQERGREQKIALLRNLLCIPLFYGNFLSCMLIYHYCSEQKQHERMKERASERAHETFPEGPIAFPFDL